MNKKRLSALTLGAAIALTLAACGGGGGDDKPSPTAEAKIKTISFFGAPRVGATAQSTAKAAGDVASAPDAASAPSDAQQTVTDLQAALQAKGVPAQVSVGVMDGTTLHQLIMGENNGLPPTPDQFKTVATEWIIVNFKFDDMVTDISSPNQQAAMAQFQHDMSVFLQRMAVAGKRTFIIPPIPTCKDESETFSAAYNVAQAERQALYTSSGDITGELSRGSMPAGWEQHMGADCLTPDASIVQFQTDKIAAAMAERYAFIAEPASGAAAASAPIGASQ